MGVIQIKIEQFFGLFILKHDTFTARWILIWLLVGHIKLNWLNFHVVYRRTLQLYTAHFTVRKTAKLNAASSKVKAQRYVNQNNYEFWKAAASKTLHKNKERKKKNAKGCFSIDINCSNIKYREYLFRYR